MQPPKPEVLRRDFPALDQAVNGRPLIYLDSAATAQKPLSVLAAMDAYYKRDNANVHRGVHTLAERATAALEAAREKVQRFLGAAEAREIVFVRGTTEAINLVAQAFARPRLQPGDEIVVTALEHHSNLVPWQLACAQTGATLKVVDIDDRGALKLDELDRLLGPRTKLCAVTHVSNALGTETPIRAIVERAHARGVPVLVDGAQAVPHLAVDVRGLGCDFYAFSGHKLYGPMGIGALYGRAALLESMSPWQSGGEMVAEVRFERATYQPIPYKFEAGTPDVAGAIGLGAAIDYLSALDRTAIAAHERALVSRCRAALSEIPGLRLLADAPESLSSVAFALGDLHPHDVGAALDLAGIAVRTGHLCAQPLLRRLGVSATIRASFALYNSAAEVDALAAALAGVRATLGA